MALQNFLARWPRGICRAVALDETCTRIAAAIPSAMHALRNVWYVETQRQLTVEPGLYFIPELIAQWRGEGRHAGLIDYDAFDRLRGSGGIRIEDDVQVTASGGQVLGPPIARSADDIERAMQSGA